MEIINGKIVSLDERGMMILAPYGNIDRAVLRQYDKVEIGLPDGRSISPEQRRKAHALLDEIADWVGALPEYIKRQMKMEFIANRMKALEKTLFSLADCDMTLAKEFITYLIDFILAHDIPTRVPLMELCEDIGRYVYACLLHKKCAICGLKADLHHWDAIGMGRDRDTVPQIGWPVVSLCRVHHTEAHTKGRTWLAETMHLQPVALTDELGKKYKLTKKNRGIA